jgi:hypothetical protein
MFSPGSSPICGNKKAAFIMVITRMLKQTGDPLFFRAEVLFQKTPGYDSAINGCKSLG